MTEGAGPGADGTGLSWRTKPTLIGDRVRLRPFTAQDAAAMAVVLDDAELLRLTGSVDSSAQAARGFVPDEAFHEWYASRGNAPDRLDLAVIDDSTGMLVGEVVLNERDLAAESCNLRILLGAAGRDRGLGTEATALITAYGLDVLGLQRISLEVYDFNPRARRVYEKVGYVHEATIPGALTFDGAPMDVHVMAITPSSSGAP